MTASSQLPAPNLMPLMRYRDLAGAMGWLEQAFGFEKQIAVADGDGAVIYGQMTYRGGLIMMGAVRDTDLDKLMRQPDEVGGVETQSCYLVVDDADEHYQRALTAGADVVLELKSDGLGRRGYSCRDPEGHIWSFGTYNPGKSLTSAGAVPPQPEIDEPLPAPPQRNRRLLMGLAGLVALGAMSWLVFGVSSSDLANVREAERAYAELVKVRAEKRQADERLAALQGELNAERQRVTALKADTASADALAKEKAGREAAEKEAVSLKEELKRAQAEHEAERQRLAAAQSDTSAKSDTSTKSDAGAKTVLAQTEALAKEKAGREAAEKEAASLKNELKKAQAERDAERQRVAAARSDTDAKSDAAAKTALAQAQALAKEKTEREAAEKALVALRDELRREQAERDAAVEAKRVLEKKLTSAAKGGESFASSDTGIPVPPSDAAENGPSRNDLTTGSNRMETSATTRREEPEEPAATRGKPTMEARRERISRAQRNRKVMPMSLRRYPTYVTDLKHVWPYSQWSQ